MRWPAQSPGQRLVRLVLCQVELERHLDELLHLLSAYFRRAESHVRQCALHRGREEVVRRFEHLEGVHDWIAERVHDELREHFAFDVRRAEQVRLPRRRISRHRRDLLFDLEFEKGVIGRQHRRSTASVASTHHGAAHRRTAAPERRCHGLGAPQ